MRRNIGLMVAIVAIGVFACGAQALYVEKWEMDVDMTTAGAGTVNGTALVANGGGSGTYGTDGFDYAGGIATFLDDTASSGNQGVTLTAVPGLALLGSGGYTLDMRIKWLSGCGGNGSQKSMGFAGTSGTGRGLRVDQGWLHSVSSGVVASGGIDMTDWQDLRVVVPPSGIWTIYRYLTNIVVLASPTAGDTPTKAIVGTGPGFFLGSMGGSSTTDCKFQLDYVRVAQGTDVLTDHTPEPATLSLLTLGAMAILRRRRS